MPTYQYRCKDCGHDFEIQQSFTDDSLDTCPECSGALKKVYGNVGISFKGSGFYKNDSRSGSTSTKAASPSSGSSSDNGSSNESSSNESSSSESSSNGSASSDSKSSSDSGSSDKATTSSSSD